MVTKAEWDALNSEEINPDLHKLDLLQASFFRGEEDGLDYCRIVNMHDQGKNDVIQKVDPSHIRRWPKLWRAFNEGRIQREATAGTPLGQIPGMDEATALVLRSNNIGDAEAILRASDLLLEALIGSQAKPIRAGARLVIRAREADRLEAMLEGQTAPALPQPEGDEPDLPDVSKEVEAIVAAEANRHQPRAPRR